MHALHSKDPAAAAATAAAAAAAADGVFVAVAVTATAAAAASAAAAARTAAAFAVCFRELLRQFRVSVHLKISAHLAEGFASLRDSLGSVAADDAAAVSFLLHAALRGLDSS